MVKDIERLRLIEFRYLKLMDILQKTGLCTLIDFSELMLTKEETDKLDVKIDIMRDPYHHTIFELVRRWGNKESVCKCGKSFTLDDKYCNWCGEERKRG